MENEYNKISIKSNGLIEGVNLKKKKPNNFYKVKTPVPYAQTHIALSTISI